MRDESDVLDHPVARAWASWVNDDAYVARVWPDVATGQDVAKLTRFSPQVLRAAAIRSRRSGTTADLRLPLAVWAAACVEVTSGSQAVENARERAVKLVQRRRSSAQHLVRTRLAFDGDITDHALDVLDARAADGIQDETRLRLLPAKWRVAPAGSLSGAPVIEATRLEIAIVSLLSNTDVNWQFSSTPQGHVFASVSNGYTREESERDYVSGLSVVIDTVAGVIERHRKGKGGRVFVTSRHVECAECKRVVAWVNEPGTRATAFQACPGVRRR